MTNRELKEKIENRVAVDEFLILVTTNGHNFIADQYANALAKLSGMKLHYANSVAETFNATIDLLNDGKTAYNVIHTDVFSERLDFVNVKDTVVICQSIDKNIENLVKDYTVVMSQIFRYDKYQDRYFPIQGSDAFIKSYIKLNLPTLDDKTVDLIYDYSHADIYLIDNIISILSMYSGKTQENILNKMIKNYDFLYHEVGQLELYSMIALVDEQTISSYLAHQEDYGIKPYTLIGKLLDTYKKILFITKTNMFDKEKAESEFLISDKQYYYYRYLKTNLSLDYIANAIDFLSKIDFKIKTGALDADDNEINDYILFNLIRLNRRNVRR